MVAVMWLVGLWMALMGLVNLWLSMMWLMRLWMSYWRTCSQASCHWTTLCAIHLEQSSVQLLQGLLVAAVVKQVVHLSLVTH